MARPMLPTPKGQTAEIPIYGNSSWRFDGLEELPSPFRTGWPEGWVPDDIRRQMLTHFKVYQSVQNLRGAILGDGGRVIPAVPMGHKNFDRAREIARMCHFSLRHIDGSWHGSARQLLDCVHECHKVAPKIFREQMWGEYRGYWMLDKLPVWPNHVFRFLRDRAGNTRRLKVRTTGGNWKEHDRTKFAVLTFRPVNNSPWGTTPLSAAYEPFYKDVQIDPEEMANVAQYGRPTVVVVAPGVDANGNPPADVPLWNVDGTPLLDPTTGEQKKLPVNEAIALKLQDYEAGSLLVLPGGSSFKLVEAQQGGVLFASLHDRNGSAITSAIVGTDQLTESRNQLSSDNKGIAQDVAGIGVTDGKRALEEMVENDIFRQLVAFNYGENALDFLPIFDLGSGENARLIQLMNAVGAYVSNGAFDKTQWWEYCVLVGLPLPDPDSEPVVASTRSSGGAHGNVAPDSAPLE